MSHELVRFSQKLYNTPLLIEQSAFKGILKFLETRNSGNYDVEARRGEESDSGESVVAYNEDTKTGVLNISGPITNKPVTIMGFDCGGTSYEGLKADFQALVEQGAKTVVFMVDSPGGMAYGAFDTANYMRQLATENGIKIISYIEGLSASAAYVLTSISDEIITNGASEIGSIGVLVQLMNDSKALEKEGYKRTFITAGKSKVPFNDDGEFREDFIEDIQSKVDVTYKEFVDHVAYYRNISAESVIATEAKTFLSGKAVELGLVDQIMTLESFYDYVADMAAPPQKEDKMFKRPSKLVKLNTQEETQTMTLAELQSQLEASTGQVTSLSAELSGAKDALLALQSTLGEKDAALAELTSQVESLTAEKVETKVKARKDALSKVLAVDKVETTAQALSGLDDASFETVLSSYKAQADVAKTSALMQELGGEGEVLETTPVEGGESLTLKILKARNGIKD